MNTHSKTARMTKLSVALVGIVVVFGLGVPNAGAQVVYQSYPMQYAQYGQPAYYSGYAAPAYQYGYGYQSHSYPQIRSIYGGWTGPATGNQYNFRMDRNGGTFRMRGGKTGNDYYFGWSR